MAQLVLKSDAEGVELWVPLFKPAQVWRGKRRLFGFRFCGFMFKKVLTSGTYTVKWGNSEFTVVVR